MFKLLVILFKVKLYARNNIFKFPLTLTCASTVHKIQGLSLEQSVFDFDLQRRRSIGVSQIYTALIRVKTYDKFYCV